jgi:hypothetical protein
MSNGRICRARAAQDAARDRLISYCVAINDRFESDIQLIFPLNLADYVFL